MFVWTFLLKITHTIISQSSADSSWITLYILCLSCLLKNVRDCSGDRPAPYRMGKTAGAWRYVTYISCKVKNQWRRTVTLHTPSRCEQGRLCIYRHCLKARTDAGSGTMIESLKSRYTGKVGGSSNIYIYIYMCVCVCVCVKNTILQLFWCQT
jgi:hypothetical protein